MLYKTLTAFLLLSCNSLSFLAEHKTVLPGFHITIKSNNANNVVIKDKWNRLNDEYQNFVSDDLSQHLINVHFNDWQQIINHNPNSNINQVVYQNFIQQINNEANNLNLLKNNTNNFENKPVGHSVASINLNPHSPISSFGNLYVPYHDMLPTEINNGVFAKIYPQYNFRDYFSVPYTLTADSQIINQTINQRIKFITIGNQRNPLNERQLVILAKQPDEKMLINNSESNVIYTNNLAYVFLDHSISDHEKSTDYNIDIKNITTDQKIYSKVIKLVNNTSPIVFLANDESKNDAILPHDYLVFNNSTNNNNMIVINEARNKAKVKLFNNSEWLKYRVNAQTLAIDFNSGIKVDPLTPLTIENFDDSYEIYYLQDQLNLNNKDSQSKTNNSGQFLVIYRDNCPNFNNWTNFNSGNNINLFQGFQQYLSSISTDMNIKDLENDASQFINYFNDYQQDLHNFNFVNYLGNDKAKPWHLNTTSYETTILSNWKIIIVASFLILGSLIALPIIIYFFKKEKRLK